MKYNHWIFILLFWPNKLSVKRLEVFCSMLSQHNSVESYLLNRDTTQQIDILWTAVIEDWKTVLWINPYRLIFIFQIPNISSNISAVWQIFYWLSVTSQEASKHPTWLQFRHFSQSKQDILCIPVRVIWMSLISVWDCPMSPLTFDISR